jgi:NADH:ubiquinone oxidoreductase subunit 4 (subunit M)
VSPGAPRPGSFPGAAGAASITPLVLALALEFILFHLFLATSYLSFYVFFELSLIPIYLLLALLGSRLSKLKAGLYLLFYTLVASLLFLIPLLYLIHELGSTDFHRVGTLAATLDGAHLLYLSLFFSLAVKVPLPPLHS